jgi:hypothetical protein
VPWWRARRRESGGQCAGYQFNVTFLRYFLAPIFEVHEVKQAGPHEMVLKWCAHLCTQRTTRPCGTEDVLSAPLNEVHPVSAAASLHA